MRHLELVPSIYTLSLSLSLSLLLLTTHFIYPFFILRRQGGKGNEREREEETYREGQREKGELKERGRYIGRMVRETDVYIYKNRGRGSRIYIERDIDTETGMKSEKGRESGEIETDTEKWSERRVEKAERGSGREKRRKGGSYKMRERERARARETIVR